MRLDGCGAANVDCWCDGLEVVEHVDAASVAAEVVKLEAVRKFSYQLLVQPPMSQNE
jgi:hypothetical protein